MATTQENLPLAGPAPFHWTVDRLYRAIDAGVFEHPERLELIKGELIEKMGQNPAHSGLIDLLAEGLRERFTGRYTVREEKPLHISDDTEPVPDIMIVTGSRRDYLLRHPSPSEVVLLIEVADSSAGYDTQNKAAMYAQSGVVEYWVVVLPAQEVIVHREPTGDGYVSVNRLRANDSVALLAAPDVQFTLGALVSESQA